jgi:hypothetical protein
VVVACHNHAAGVLLIDERNFLSLTDPALTRIMFTNVPVAPVADLLQAFTSR